MPALPLEYALRLYFIWRWRRASRGCVEVARCLGPDQLARRTASRNIWLSWSRLWWNWLSWCAPMVGACATGVVGVRRRPGPPTGRIHD